ncbi:hypothetical protein CDD83_10578 [Cordyceps sp. RAO-2017]|nr:hypothetical protein CDD83_10578 [Cordyceps sp. RAO-2017]
MFSLFRPAAAKVEPPASPPPTAPSSASAQSPSPAPPSSSSDRSTGGYSPLGRHARQLGLFVAGASLFAASIAVSRRSVLRRRREALPAFHTSNRQAAGAVDASDRLLLATQALGLATLNVLGFGIFLTGGIAWGFDLCSVAELRRRTQAAIRRPSSGQDPEAEREMERMMASLLQRLGMDATPPAKPAPDQAVPTQDRG